MEYWIKFNELGPVGWTIFIAYAIFSIWMMVWAYRRKGILGFLLAFFLNWVGWIIVLCLPRDKGQRERERERLINFLFAARFFVGQKEIKKIQDY